MKKVLLLPVILCGFLKLHAQFVHKIKADSVLITNDSCTAELNLENSTKNVKGFLYNKGNGRTEFRKPEKLNDSTIVFGSDTITLKGAGTGWLLSGNSGTTPSANFLGTTDNQALVMRTNNLERMRIDATGKIGIGTNNPQKLVHIKNTVGGSGFTWLEDSPLALMSNSSDGFPDMHIYNHRGNRIGAFGGRTRDNQIYVIADSSDLVFWTGDPTIPRLVIKSGGNIGIGGGAPTAKLHVAGTGLFNDTLTATTMGNTDSSNRVASTAWVKRLGLGLGAGLNGITRSVNDFKLGGELIEPTIITSSAGTNNIKITGVNTNTDSALLYVENNRNGRAIRALSDTGTAIQGKTHFGKGLEGIATYVGTGVSGTSQDGYGVRGFSSSSIGVDGGSTTSSGVRGSSSSGTGVEGITASTFYPAISGMVHGTGPAYRMTQLNQTSTNDITTIGSYEKLATSTVSSGYGMSCDYSLSSSNWSIVRPVGRFVWRWSTATDASRTSAFDIYTTYNTVHAVKATLAGSGQWTWQGYPALAAQTDTAAYKPIAIDGSGNVVKMSQWPGGYTIRVNTTTSSSTIIPNALTDDVYAITALAENTTIASPSGSFRDGQIIILRIKDNGTSYTISWNAIYRGGTDFILPTSTSAGKTMYITFIWNAPDSKLDAVGLSKGY